MNNTKWILSVARMLIGHSVSIGQGYGVTLPTPAFHRQCTQGDATLNHHPAVRATNDAITPQFQTPNLLRFGRMRIIIKDNKQNVKLLHHKLENYCKKIVAMRKISRIFAN